MNRCEQCDWLVCLQGLLVLVGLLLGAVVLGYVVHNGIRYAEWFIRHVWG